MNFRKNKYSTWKGWREEKKEVEQCNYMLFSKKKLKEEIYQRKRYWVNQEAPSSVTFVLVSSKFEFLSLLPLQMDCDLEA